MLPSLVSITAKVAVPLRVAAAKAVRSVCVPLSWAGGGSGGGGVVRRIQREAQARRELLQLIVERRQHAVAHLEQAGERAAADPAGDLLAGIRHRIVQELGR